MGNLTEAFSQIVEKIEKENGIEPSVQSPSSLVSDTFVKESVDLVCLVDQVETIGI